MKIDRVLIHPAFQNKLSALVQGELEGSPVELAKRAAYGIKGLYFQVVLHRSVSNNNFWYTKVRQIKGVNIRTDEMPLGWYPELRIPTLDPNRRMIVLIDPSIRNRMPVNDDPEKIQLVEIDEHRQEEAWSKIRSWILAQVNQLVP